MKHGFHDIPSYSFFILFFFYLRVSRGNDTLRVPV